MPAPNLAKTSGLDEAVLRALTAYLIERGVAAPQAASRAAAKVAAGKAHLLSVAEAADVEHDGLRDGFAALKVWAATNT